MQLFSFSAYQLHQTPNKGSALQIHHRWLVALETMCSIHEHFIRSVWNVSVRNIFGKHKKVCWKYLFYLVYCNFMNSYSKDETFQLLYPRFISSHVYKKRRVPILSDFGMSNINNTPSKTERGVYLNWVELHPRPCRGEYLCQRQCYVIFFFFLPPELYYCSGGRFFQSGWTWIQRTIETIAIPMY
jgi:hypothetical protein